MNINYNYTIKERIESLGDGKWNQEPDYIEYQERGLDCYIVRVIKETGAGLFGGHLCGYVKLPEGLSDYDVEDFEVHGGITWDKTINGDRYIGFDCAHAFDIIPSIKEMRNKFSRTLGDNIDEILSIKNSDTYKNIEYVKQELKQLVDQILLVVESRGKSNGNNFS